LIIDPITMIYPINAPEQDLITDPMNEHQQMTNLIMDLNLYDDELSVDLFENYDMCGRPYINKKLQKKIAARRSIQESSHVQPIPKQNKPCHLRFIRGG
jgi:hypothetical protein